VKFSRIGNSQLPGVTFWGLVRDESHAGDGCKEAKAGHSGADDEHAERSRCAGNFFVCFLASSNNERSMAVARGAAAHAAGVREDVAP